MITVSDNAAPDLVRNKLGDDALVAVAERVGWTEPELPSYLGQAVALVLPQRAAPPDAGIAERAEIEWALARQYAADPVLRAEAAAAPLPDGAMSLAWAEGTPGATATALESLHRAVATESVGPGSSVARAQLEWAPAARRAGVGRQGRCAAGYRRRGADAAP